MYNPVGDLGIVGNEELRRRMRRGDRLAVYNDYRLYIIQNFVHYTSNDQCTYPLGTLFLASKVSLILYLYE